MSEFSLGANIRQNRLQHNWTQENLAAILCISHQVISKWENDLTTPDIYTLCSLARIFGVTLDELCGMAPKQVDVIIQDINTTKQQNKTYDSLYSKWVSIHRQLSFYPTDPDFLFSVLGFLRTMHDTVETEEQKQYTNAQILVIAERILDFSKDDSHRSFAHYNLALYYSEQVSCKNSDEANRSYANKAKSHADLVLYKDMHKTFYHSLGTANVEDERIAQEKTLIELLNATKQAGKNLLHHYAHNVSGNTRSSKETCAILSEFLEEWESISSKISFLHTASCV